MLSCAAFNPNTTINNNVRDEGLFALLQGLRRLAQTGRRRVRLPTIAGIQRPHPIDALLQSAGKQATTGTVVHLK